MSIKNHAIDKTKKPASEDWHKADIVAAIWKRDTSLQRLSRQRDYSDAALATALHRPWPKAERIIAGVIGVAPHAIWPSRYNEDGTSKSGRGERGIGRYKAKHSTRRVPVNGHRGSAV
jgi:Ner family transcriptional regulator